MRIKSTSLALLFALGCGTDPAPIDEPIKGIQGDDGGGKEDRWTRISDPSRFTGQFNYHLADMPLEGTAENESWPSTYWPTYEDAINHRWHSNGGTLELSPAEKYDIAFNGWTPPADFMSLRPFHRDSPVPGDDWDTEYYNNLGPLASHVSQNMGNRSDRQMAVTNGGAPPSGTEWNVETWWGLCHAWVPAAILEARPERTVTHNGVDFHVGDLEALLIAAYNRAPAEMIGGRCNMGNGEETVTRDEYGRAVNAECRDSNPGALHVIVTNFLGGQNRGFAMDRTFDYQVWNQPVVGYEITKQSEITATRANELLARTGDTYVYNNDAAKLYEVKLSLHWITESHASVTPADAARYTRTDHVSYILEVDSAGKVIGGEYFGASRSQHPDFLWNPSALTRSSVPNLNLDNIRMLVERSRTPDMPDPGNGGEYVATGMGGIAIPDNNATGVRSTATVSGAAGTVTSVTVDLNLTHTYIGDLDVVLSKGGVERPLHSRTGGSADNIVDMFMVTGFEGIDPNGAWTLRVSDRAGADVGTLNSWTLTVNTNEAGTPVDPPTPMAMRFAGRGGISIPDNAAAGITSAAVVSGVTRGAVDIEVDITHTWRGDLQVTVAHGTNSWVLHNQEGGSADDLQQTFSLDATGTAFQGDPSGEWTLTVSDNAGQDLGTLNGWAVLVR